MDTYLQQLNRAHDADPGNLRVAQALIAALRRAGTSQEVVRYRPRNLPCNIMPDDQLWCVVGGISDPITGESGGGVLEWCYDEDDAKTRLKMMEADPRYSMLHVAKYWPDCAWCKTSKPEREQVPGQEGRRYCNDNCRETYCEEFGYF